MNVLRSNYVFPSYSKIKQQIFDKRDREYQRTIHNLTQKLAHMNQTNNLSADHQKIKNGIITLAAQQANQKNVIEKQHLTWASPRNVLDRNNQQSLNYYIEDDKEEENNYQTYLKFKKKALERDLQEDKYDRLSGKEKRKQQEQEQHLFKNLYHYDKQNGDNMQKRKNHRQFSYSNLKNHASNFKKQIDRISTAKPSKRVNNPSYLHGQRQRIMQQLNNRDHRQKVLYQKNKKLLTQNYSDILKKLDSANIVKWRILNVEQNVR